MTSTDRYLILGHLCNLCITSLESHPSLSHHTRRIHTSQPVQEGCLSKPISASTY
jgi:hypothetical protein